MLILVPSVVLVSGDWGVKLDSTAMLDDEDGWTDFDCGSCETMDELEGAVSSLEVAVYIAGSLLEVVIFTIVIFSKLCDESANDINIDDEDTDAFIDGVIITWLDADDVMFISIGSSEDDVIIEVEDDGWIELATVWKEKRGTRWW